MATLVTPLDTETPLTLGRTVTPASDDPGLGIARTPVVGLDDGLASSVFTPLTNDNIANVLPVIITVDGATYTSPLIKNTNFSNETNEPHAGTNGAVKTAWWKYQPVANGTATFSTSGSTAINSTDTGMWLYSGTLNTAVAGWGLTAISFDDDSGGNGTSKLSNVAVTAGTTYWIQVGSWVSGDLMNYRLAVTGPHVATTVDADLQLSGSMGLRLGLSSSDLAVDVRVSQPLLFAVDPVTFHSTVHGAFLTAVSPVTAHAGVGPGTLQGVWHQPVQPADGASVPTAQPAFVIDFSRAYGMYTTAEVSVTYTYDPGTGPVHTTINTSVAVLPGVNQVSLQPASAIPATHVDWTYSILFSSPDPTVGSLTVTMTGTRSFTIGTATSNLMLDTPVTWSVQTGTPTPHLWMVYPPAGSPGSHATVYGHGFAAAPGSVTIAGVSADVTNWTLVAASLGSTTANRAIDAAGGVADPEHYEVTFAVPDAPSGPLILQD